MIDTVQMTVSGISGSVDSTRPVNGRVIAVHVAFTNGDAGGDVTLATKGKAAPAQTVLALTDNNTSGWRYPRTQVQGSTGTGLTYDGTRTINEPVVVDDYLTLTVAQGAANQVTVVTALVEC